MALNDDVTASPPSAAGGPTFRAHSDGTRLWNDAVVAYVVTVSPGANELQAVDATHGLPSSIVSGVMALETGGNLAILAGAISGGRMLVSGPVVLGAGSAFIGNIGLMDPARVPANIVAADVASSSTTNFIGQTIITGAPTGSSTVAVALSAESTLRIQLTTANFSGTVQFEKSIDGGTTWQPEGLIATPGATNLASTTLIFPGTTQNVMLRSSVAGMTNFRVRATAVASGTLTVSLQPSYGNLEIASTASLRTNANRNAGILHRSGITSPDKLATPVVSAASAVTEAGSTLPNSALSYTVAAGNRWGVTLPAAVQSITPTLNQAVRIPIAAVTGAVYYDIFLSGAATPLWVGRITAAQLAAGGFIISTVGNVTAGGGAGAGAIDIGIVGTGNANNSAPFAANNAYTPTAPTPINCAGYSRAHVHCQLSLTDLRSIPALTIVPFFQDQVSNSDWFMGLPLVVSVLTGLGTPLEQDFELDIDGATAFVVLVDAIAGQGAAFTGWVELA